MKKILIIFGVILAAILMVSSTTAVPTAQATETMNYMEKIEENRQIIDLFTVFPILEWLLSLLNSLLNIFTIIENVLNLILSPIQIIYNIVTSLVNALQTIFENWDLIESIIEFLRNLFNPSSESVDLAPN